MQRAESNTRRKQQDEQRMRFRRAIESYDEQRQLQAQLSEYPELLARGARRAERAGLSPR